MAQHYLTFAVRDASNELSRFTVFHGAITAASIAGYLTQVGALRTALTNLILGIVATEQITMDSTVLSNALPGTPNAQIELKLQFSYQGDTSLKKFRHELPTADPAVLVAGTDVVDLTHADVAAYITAFEAIGRSPDDDTETVTVLNARLVGRNI